MKSKNNMKFITIINLISLFLSATIALADRPREIPDRTPSQQNQIMFNSSNYQSSILSDDSLGTLAKAQSHVGTEASSFGFAAKSDEAKFFIIGTLYSEALAFISDSNFEMTADRLKLIESQFVVLQSPSSLYNYISKVRSCIIQKKHSQKALFDMLSFFQPFFEEYAQRISQDKLILFRAGSWLMDMTLTAAAGDKALIKQAKPQLKYFTKEMNRMDAPKGVMKSYQDINKIADKKEISDADVKQVLKRVKRIQAILG